MSENFRPNVCGKYALQGSSRALYTPLTQPTNNAPDLYHFTRLGMLYLFEVEQSRMVVCWADLIWWSGLTVVVWSDGLILVVWSDDGLVREFVHGLICGRDLRLIWLSGVMVWSGADLMGCCCCLVWRLKLKLKRWEAEEIVVKRL